jgi:hypothetical protein
MGVGFNQSLLLIIDKKFAIGIIVKKELQVRSDKIHVFLNTIRYSKHLGNTVFLIVLKGWNFYTGF